MIATIYGGLWALVLLAFVAFAGGVVVYGAGRAVKEVALR